MKINGRHEIRTIQSSQEIEEIRGFWEKVQYHPNTDIDHYLTIINSMENLICPYIILFSSDGRPEALAIGRLERKDMDISLGYKTLFKVKTTCLTILYAGLLGNWSKELYNILVKELMDALRSRTSDIVWFNLLYMETDLYNITRQLPNFFCRDHVIARTPHWKMTLPNTFDEFMKKMTSKHRYWLNRLPRVLEKDYPGKVAYKDFHNRDNLEQFFADAEHVAKTSYQRSLGAGFIDNSIMRQRFSLYADKGHLRAYLLYVGGEPCAFWIGTLYGNVFYLNFTSYDAAYKRYEPGTILFIKMIEDVIKSGTTEIDFGFGDAFYKQRFGNQQWDESSTYIYAPTIKGILTNLTRSATIIPYLYIRNMAERKNILQKIKTVWRNKLRK
ncbi:MAG: hypothetical protein BWX99_01915 [Deltaproteobacteria bacterium ADurb.Bin151]|nr:MAG: hypothetical protein BWX99_01915 [Deltaproteobacteria bacterium ADurb.Bin151]